MAFSKQFRRLKIKESIRSKITGTGTNTLTINPAGVFASGTQYYVNVANSVIADPANNFFGGVKVEGTSLEFSTNGSTMMMGTPELMAQENEFLKSANDSPACSSAMRWSPLNGCTALLSIAAMG